MKEQLKALNTYFWNVGNDIADIRLRWRCLKTMRNHCISWVCGATKMLRSPPLIPSAQLSTICAHPEGIHDPDPPGHNPHAHILLTIRPLDEQGKWQYKIEKEYLCVRNGEERGFTAAEFLHAQDDGWEKQYSYLIGKKKICMTVADGEVQGLKRASKHPKSTTYGRQNPITEQ